MAPWRFDDDPSPLPPSLSLVEMSSPLDVLRWGAGVWSMGYEEWNMEYEKLSMGMMNGV